MGGILLVTTEDLMVIVLAILGLWDDRQSKKTFDELYLDVWYSDINGYQILPLVIKLWNVHSVKLFLSDIFVYLHF